MGITPPLPPNNGPQGVQQPGVPPSPGYNGPQGVQQPGGPRGGKRHSPKKPGGSNVWLIVGCSLAGLLLLAAVLLYFLTDLFSSDSYEYDDGNRNEKVLRQKDQDDEKGLRKAPSQEEDVPVTANRAASLYGRGHNGESACSLDIDIDADGNISGTYWNIFGNLEFYVNGQQTTDGSLEMTLTTVKDNVSTPLTLHTSDGHNYYGKWGKKQNPVEIALYDGNSRGQEAPNIVYRWHVKGPGSSSVINAEVCITEENGSYYYWYATQGYANRLRMSETSYGFHIYNSNGEQLATIIVNEDGTATMTDTHDQTFTVTAIE